MGEQNSPENSHLMRAMLANAVGVSWRGALIRKVMVYYILMTHVITLLRPADSSMESIAPPSSDTVTVYNSVMSVVAFYVLSIC